MRLTLAENPYRSGIEKFIEQGQEQETELGPREGNGLRSPGHGSDAMKVIA